MNKQNNILTGFLILAALIIIAVFFSVNPFSNTANNTPEQNSPTFSEPTRPEPQVSDTNTPKENSPLASPISNSQNRITKKPFGIQISPQSSPVQPEKFSGFHTGTDFETTTEETSTVIEIKALCSGKLLQKRTASGYGGVAVQACTINNQAVTVIYGHVALDSIQQKVGDTIEAGQVFAHLGNQGTETDGERKHLHLGIHKGSLIDIKGYVPAKASLNDWIDYQSLEID